jgi:hypothetical protein
MIASQSSLVTLLALVERLPQPPAAPVGRGRPRTYSDRLFLKALVIMVTKHLTSVHELYTVLTQPTAEMQTVRDVLAEHGRLPTRRTFERRLETITPTLPAQIASLGASLVEQVQVWQQDGCAAAIDSTVLRAHGGVWHQKHRDAGIVPHSSIDVEAHWTKSGWHGWVYGWKLHLIVTVGAVWLPLAADLTAANVADNVEAEVLLATLATTIRYLLGDTSYNDQTLRERCDDDGITLVASQRGPHPHTDDGTQVRKLFHQLRSHAIENFNGQFKSIFDANAAVPTKGLLNTRRLLLGAVLVYQLTVWCRYEAGSDLRKGLKAFLKAA